MQGCLLVRNFLMRPWLCEKYIDKNVLLRLIVKHLPSVSQKVYIQCFIFHHHPRQWIILITITTIGLLNDFICFQYSLQRMFPSVHPHNHVNMFHQVISPSLASLLLGLTDYFQLWTSFSYSFISSYLISQLVNCIKHVPTV